MIKPEEHDGADDRHEHAVEVEAIYALVAKGGISPASSTTSDSLAARNPAACRRVATHADAHSGAAHEGWLLTGEGADLARPLSRNHRGVEKSPRKWKLPGAR
jgi:hypothetical protein